MKNFLISLLASSFIVATFAFMCRIMSTKYRSEVFENQRQIDSLKSEIFTLETQLTRYQMSEECLQKTDSISSIKFEKCFSQTE